MNSDHTISPEELRPEKIQSVSSVGQDAHLPQQPSSESFAAHMQPSSSMQGGNVPSSVSPFDLLQGHPSMQTSSVQTILAQTEQAQRTLGDLTGQLQTPGLKLRQSQNYILKNKLLSANAHLRAVNAKLGNPEIPPSDTPKDGGPFAKFVSYITDGQRQLESAKTSLEQLRDKGDKMNPADMLIIQLKLNKAQQMIEYSSVVLSKLVDDTKTILSVQIS